MLLHHWLQHRKAWFYVFRTEERLETAKKDILSFANDSGLTLRFATITASESWVRRVQT